MTEVTTVAPEDNTARPASPSPAGPPPTRRDLDPIVRRRMRRQAQIMLLVAFLMLAIAFSVPFVLHYLNITIP